MNKLAKCYTKKISLSSFRDSCLGKIYSQERNIMDTIIQKDREDMEIIAKSNNDYPVLMINQNRYLKSEFPDGELYSKWRTINKKMIRRNPHVFNNKNIEYCKNISSACFRSDLIIIHTEWNEFKFIDFKKIVKKNNFKIYDMRNIYDPKRMKLNKIKYFAVGRTV